jgi:Xaa-Pro aminopeptidase
MTGVAADALGRRHQGLAAALAKRSLDALLVSHPPNIAYLTGFTGSAAFVIATADRLWLLSDARYAQTLGELSRQVAYLTPVVVPPGGGSLEEALATTLASLAPGPLGFESPHLTVRQHLDLDRRLRQAGCPAELTAADSTVEDLRLVKDAWEVSALREGGRRLSDVAKCILPKALAGTSEREIAALIEWEMRRKGFERPAFDTIVASGPNAAMPHYRAGDRRLAAGDLVVIDFGGMFQEYALDMTRTLVVGPGATPRQLECLAAVGAAQAEAFRVARVGTAPEDVDAAARRVLAAAGMGDAFAHGLGHGLGLEVHERPRLSRRRPDQAQDVLAAGMVFTLEPGVYFPGWGGVRIEDDVLATPAGPEWLTEPVHVG